VQAFSKADIYVSGIGTGFVGSFLQPDGSVAVNVGHQMSYGNVTSEVICFL
jgi:hypothetical protein